MQPQELQKLQENIKGKTIILTVGNSLKGDDGFGPALASRIKDRIPTVIDGGITPENYVSTIIKQAPDTILVIDAADFKGRSGEARLFDIAQLRNLSYFTTHSFPMEYLLKFLKENCQSAQVMFLGVQPKSVKFGQGLSQELEAAENSLRSFLVNLLATE